MCTWNTTKHLFSVFPPYVNTVVFLRSLIVTIPWYNGLPAWYRIGCVFLEHLLPVDHPRPVDTVCNCLLFALCVFLSLSIRIPLLAFTYMQVNTNGLLSFTTPQPFYLPVPFSLANQQLVAPFWGDVDTRGSGDVFFRETSDPALITEVGMEIRRSFVNSRGFFPTSLFIATWNDVGYYDNRTDLVSES